MSEPDPHWPYRAMVNDVRLAIDGGANYLAALGLVAYCEIIGRWILQREEPGSHPANWRCFRRFVEGYVEYEFRDEQQARDVYDWFRNGLAHEYFIKGDASVIATDSNRPDGPGLFIKNALELRAIVLKPFFRDFRRGVERWLAEIASDGGRQAKTST